MGLSKLSKDDLTRRLQRLSEELEELEEERDFVLKQTGLHLPGHTVKKYESDSTNLQKSVSEVKTELGRRKLEQI